MDGGGDRKQPAHFLLSQESRRRVENHQYRFVGITRGYRNDRRSDSDEDRDSESIFYINLDRMERLGHPGHPGHLGEDSGFESGSDGN